MTPTAGTNPFGFSPASLRQVCSKLESVSCLLVPGGQTILNVRCGNGIREGTEECDCGAANGTECIHSRCCFANCTLKPNAACSNDTNSLCCNGESCSFVPAQWYKKCRPQADAQCDIAEYCDGTSGACPADRFREDGLTCTPTTPTDTVAPTYCASGLCTSRQMQCEERSQAKGHTGYLQDCGPLSGSVARSHRRVCMAKRTTVADRERWADRPTEWCGFGDRSLFLRDAEPAPSFARLHLRLAHSSTRPSGMGHGVAPGGTATTARARSPMPVCATHRESGVRDAD